MKLVQRHKTEALLQVPNGGALTHLMLFRFLGRHRFQKSLVSAIHDDLGLILEHSVIHEHRQHNERKSTQSRPKTTNITHDSLSALNAQVQSSLRQ